MKRPFEVYTDTHSQIIQAENMTQAIQIYMELNSYDSPICVEDVEPRNKIGEWFAKQKLKENKLFVDIIMNEFKELPTQGEDEILALSITEIRDIITKSLSK